MPKLLVSDMQKKEWIAASSLHFRCRGLFWPLLCFLASATASATPYVPASDDEVLVSLPAINRADPAMDIVVHADGSTGLSDTQRIGNAQALLVVAYEQANEDAFGQAEALLAPWKENIATGSMPVEVQYMLAVIRQHNHQFNEALALLDAVLEQQPTNGLALLQRAQINLVTGNYEASRQDCISLQAVVSAATVANCIAQVAAVTGKARETYTQITDLAAYQAFFSPAEYTELLVTLATIAHRLGSGDEAERYYRLIIERNGNNIYAILQYSDFLLEQQRFTEVTQLLSRLPISQLTLELQVKQLEAMRGGGLEEAYSGKYAELEEVFAIALARAENFPQKEYARFLLVASERSEEALQAALANWQYQKEPADLLLLVRAAIAANGNGEFQLARNWIASTGLEDHRINTLLANSSLGAGITRVEN